MSERVLRPAAWTGVAVLAIEAALGIATIGLFLIPVVVLLAVSVRLVPGPVAPPAPARTPASPAPASPAIDT